MFPDLSPILVVLNFGCALMCVLLAIVCAGMLAAHIAPMDPSEAETSVRHETYQRTQHLLGIVRARRLSDLRSIEDQILRADGCDTTRPVDVASIPRREEVTRKIHAVPVRAAMCVKVGDITPPPTRPYTDVSVAHMYTLSDVVARALARPHIVHNVA